MTGRTLAMVAELAFDLQPAGWRLTGSPGIDHRRATSLLAQDLDTTEELARDRSGPYKIQVAGPWTLAATVERPRGDKVLADHGARRDLAQALAEAVRTHCADVRRRLDPTELVVQIDEPALPSVLAGCHPDREWVPSSPIRRAGRCGAGVDLGRRGGGRVRCDAGAALLCCGPAVRRPAVDAHPGGLVRRLALAEQPVRRPGPLARRRSRRLARRRTRYRTGRCSRRPMRRSLTRVLTWWRGLGYTEVETLPSTTVTPSCGLAGASPSWARSALGLCERVARNLSVEQGRMEP